MVMKEQREALAEVQHEIWAHWMKYLFSCTNWITDGYEVIPPDKAERWKRQMQTPYADLTEAEKESDREQADKVLTVLAEDNTQEDLERLREGIRESSQLRVRKIEF